MDRPETTIDDIDYRLTLWPTSKAMEWKERLGTLGLESVGKLLSSDLDVSGWKVDEAMGMFLVRLKASGGYAKTVKELLELVARVDSDGNEHRVVSKGQGPEDFDQYYRGRTLHLDKLAAWVVLENFQDFTDVARWIEKGLELLSRKSSKTSAGDSETEHESSPAEATTH